jgi:hypothetical protein
VVRYPRRLDDALVARNAEARDCVKPSGRAIQVREADGALCAQCSRRAPHVAAHKMLRLLLERPEVGISARSRPPLRQDAVDANAVSGAVAHPGAGEV